MWLARENWSAGVQEPPAVPVIQRLAERQDEVVAVPETAWEDASELWWGHGAWAPERSE